MINKIREELSVFSTVVLDEESHTYTMLDDNKIIKANISMTSLLHKYSNEFDTDFQVERYAKKHNLNKEDVLKSWEYEGSFASQKGTATHNYLENLFSSKPEFMYDINKIMDLFGSDVLANSWPKLKYLANMFYEQTKEFIIPIACELKVFDKETGVAGAVDLLAYHIQSRQLIIIDYKTSKEIKTVNIYNEYMLEPFTYLPDINYYLYSLQLNGYKYIIEKNTNLKISNTQYIVWINEKNDEPRIIPTLNLYKEARYMIENERNI